MPHRFRIREIAVQSGLSPATVDRVLHGRPGVRAGTVHQVERAIADLERQETQLRLTGRTFVVDVVVQAPPRFCAGVRFALEAELPALRPAVVRARFTFVAALPDLLAALERAARTGSHGVVLKAPDVPEVTAAVARLHERGVPVVTLVTDLPGSDRVAYVGTDNRAAGTTAAYLVQQWLGERPGDVLVVRGRGSYRGEDERGAGFRAALLDAVPQRRLVEVVDDEDGGDALAGAVRDVLAREPGVLAVYSMYAGAGGNARVVTAFAESGRRCAVFLAHDLDGENSVLLRRGQLSAVLHHDLRQDLRHACQALLRARGALPGAPASHVSAIQVITPHNSPAGSGDA